MKAAFYAGATGLLAQQAAMDNIGNNIANVNTYGYLPSDVGFQTVLNTEMYANTGDEPRTEYGARIVDLGVRVGNGSFFQTDSELDFAVQGRGFFAADVNGETQYTRDGTFILMLEGDGAYLGTVDGYYVLDENSERIQVPANENAPGFNTSQLEEVIGVFEFDYPEALTPMSANMYLPNERTGIPASLNVDEKTVLQNVLEGSGVSITDEMANLIVTQRAYQMSAKVITTVDENEQLINNLRR